MLAGPSRSIGKAVVAALDDQDVPITGYSAIVFELNTINYLRDPDGNGVELYWDRPREAWPKDERDALSMFTRPLDLQGLLAEAESDADAGSGTAHDEAVRP